MRLPFPTDLPTCMRNLFVQCLDDDSDARPSFEDVCESFCKMKATSKIDESYWTVMKTRWRSTVFDYTNKIEVPW